MLAKLLGVKVTDIKILEDFATWYCPLPSKESGDGAQGTKWFQNSVLNSLT
jgi:hypothetical protein